MSRIHDMGGRQGDGPVPEIDMDELFHSDWEKQALALNLAAGALGKWNIDASRHSRELLAPKDYTAFSYFEKWVSALTDLLVQTECLSEDDLNQQALRATDTTPAALSAKTLRADNVAAAMSKGGPSLRESGPAPLYKVGEQVLTHSHNPNPVVPGGHTRLPQYAMGRVGRIAQRHGNHVLPDTNAHFAGENPEPLYAVEFDAKTLWGSAAEDIADTMVLDLWQSYLKPVTT